MKRKISKIEKDGRCLMITKMKVSRYYLFSPNAHIVFSVSIKGNPSVEAVKASIVNAVQEYEVLNSRILCDVDGEFYYVPREEFVAPTIEVCESRGTNVEFLNEQCRKEFDLEKGELIRFVLVPNKDSFEMNVIQHHIAGDGKSMLLLIRRIMNNLEEIGESGRIDCLQVREAKKMEPFTEKYISKYVKLNDLITMSLDKFNASWEDEKVVYTKQDYQRMHDEYWENNYSYLRSIEINQEQMHVFRNWCHKKGVTINNALVTMASRAFKETKKLAIVVDCRAGKFKSYGNYASSIALDIEYDESLSFWDNARKIDNLVKLNLSDYSNALVALQIYNKVDGTLLDATNFQKIDKYKCDVVKEYNDTFGLGDEGLPFAISNLGSIEGFPEYGRYEVDKISFYSPMIPALKSNFSVATINGKMIINIIYRKGIDIDFDVIIDSMQQQLSSIINNLMEICHFDTELEFQCV